VISYPSHSSVLVRSIHKQGLVETFPSHHGPWKPEIQRLIGFVQRICWIQQMPPTGPTPTRQRRGTCSPTYSPRCSRGFVRASHWIAGYGLWSAFLSCFSGDSISSHPCHSDTLLCSLSPFTSTLLDSQGNSDDWNSRKTGRASHAGEYRRHYEGSRNVNRWAGRWEFDNL